MMNLDLNNSRTLTILVIVVLILFAIVYVWMNRDGFGKEGFTNYPVAIDDVVQLQGGLNNVIVGTDNTPLKTSINYLIKEQLSNFYSFLNQQLLNSEVPPLTIVSFYGTTAPTGWQLCDGATLVAIDTKKVYDKSGKIIYTPNLQGRVIVGTNNSSINKAIPNGNTALSGYNVGDYGGEEKHTLSIDEIPLHNHTASVCWAGKNIFDYFANPRGNPSGLISGLTMKGGWDDSGVSTNVDSKNKKYIDNAGGGKPHYNMQPYYVLIYIIKKPLLGGSDNPVSSELPTNAPSVDNPKK